MTAGTSRPAPKPEVLVEELIRAVSKALRAFQMYLPNNPMYHRAEQSLQASFTPVWEILDELILEIRETDLVWEEEVVYGQANKSESFAWILYKDGMRWLTLTRGAEKAEIGQLLRIVNRARLLAADAGDDLLTLLWEEDFAHIRYQFAEVITDSVVLDPQALDMQAQGLDNPSVMQERIRKDPAPPAKAPGVVDLDDFDSTLYFLDEAEIASLAAQVKEEYTRDVRQASLDAVLDVFELVADDEVRDEVLGILDTLFLNLLNQGEFHAVGGLLREFAIAAKRAKDLTPDMTKRLESFQRRLSEPSIVAQLITAMDEMGDVVGGEAIADVLRELQPPALETILTHLPGVATDTVRDVLVSAAERLALANTGEVLRLLRGKTSTALPGLVLICGRLKLQAAVAGLADLGDQDDATLRLAAVEALAAIASPSALQALEIALDDDDRAVRVAAVSVVSLRAYKGALGRLEAVVTGKRKLTLERSEQRQFFEAYAAVAGPSALDTLAGILLPRGIFRRKEPPDARTCAAYALAKIGTPAARDILRKAEGDKVLIVRNAVSRVLRGWQ